MSQGHSARRAAVWAVFFGGLIAGAHIGKVPPALPVLRADLGLTLVESGFIATMLNVLGALAGVGAGAMCDRFGHKRLALAGLAIMAGGGLLGAFSWDFPSLLVSRFLEGAGFILYTVSGSALMAAAVTEPRPRAKAMALWSAYMPSGGSIALLVAPPVIYLYGWRGLWIGLAAASAIGYWLVSRHAIAPRFGEVRTMRLLLESLSQKGSIAISLAFAFYVAQWTSVMIWLPTFAVDQRGASAATAGFLTALMVLINVPGNLAGGWLLASGVRRARLMSVAFVIMALTSSGMLLDVLPDAIRFVLVLVFSGCAGVIPAAVFSGVPVHARTSQHIGTTNGMVMQTAQAGQFIGPIVLAWLAAHFGGWSASLSAMLAFAACGLACGVAIGRIEAPRAR